MTMPDYDRYFTCRTNFALLCAWDQLIQVVEPIERMVRLLSMLMKDPLGYQNTPQYRKLQQEGEEIAKKSMWTEEVLKGVSLILLFSMDNQNSLCCSRRC